MTRAAAGNCTLGPSYTACNEARIFRDHQFEWHDSPEHLGHEGVGTVVDTAEESRFALATPGDFGSG